MNDSTEWVPIFRTGTDYEAALISERLNDAGIPAVIQNKRDHAFNFTHGDLARITVLVQAEREREALDTLGGAPVSLDELTRQALSASPLDPADSTLVELEGIDGEDDLEEPDDEEEDAG
jgi:hypothetical protein